MKNINQLFKDKFSFLTWILLAGIGGYLLYLHFEIIFYPYPSEFREGHMMSTTKLLINGINPYILNVYPNYFNSYGILYNIVVYPFAYVFGCTLELHRLINGLFIFLSFFLLYFSFKDTIIKFPLLGTMLGLLLYSLLLIRETCIARPDTLGLFLYLCSIVIPVKNKFTNKSLILSGLFAILAFYTKSYFLSGWIVITIYLFLCKNYKKAVLSNVIFLFFFLLTGYIVYKIMPLYFYETIFAYNGSTTIFLSYSIKQIIFFPLTVIPALLYLIYFSIILIQEERFKFYSYLKTTPYTVLFLCILSLLFFPLGINTGAFLTYHYQILLPILIILILVLSSYYNKKIKGHNLVILLMTVLLAAQILYFNRKYNASVSEWKKFEYYLSGKKNILNTPVIAPLLLKQNKPIYDSGVSGFVDIFKPSLLSSTLFGLDNEILKRKEAYYQNINSQIYAKKFDALVLSKIDSEFFKQININGYALIRKMLLPLPHTMGSIELFIYEPFR